MVPESEVSSMEQNHKRVKYVDDDEDDDIIDMGQSDSGEPATHSSPQKRRRLVLK